jgi:peptidoglycan/LPS O-acetylase OafA/YrhL
VTNPLEKPTLLTQGYFHSLDGLRGLAMLLVLVFHFARIKSSTFSFEIGWIGLQIFFVLSGFLITKILLSSKEKPLKDFLRQFYLRRALRIFPLYYGYLVFLLLLFFVIHEPKDILSYIIYLLTYCYNFSILSNDWELSRMYVHLWSLSVEEQFYLVWPFAVYFLSANSLKKLMIGLILVIPLFRFLLQIYLAHAYQSKDQEMIGNIIYWFSFSHFDAFALGGAINFLQGDFLGMGKKTWLYITLLACIIAGSINAFALQADGLFQLSTLGYPLHSTINSQHVWSYSILNLFFAALIWNTLTTKQSIFNFKPLQEIGKISYGMYIFHFAILIIFEKMGIHNYNNFLALLAYLAVCILFAYLLYHGVEKRILSLKSKI